MLSANDQASDIGHLYRALGRQLERIVGKGVPAPDVVDDACQFAWTQLVSRRDRVSHESALTWLTTTAVREAFRLIHRAERELSRDALLEVFGDEALPGIAAGADEWLERTTRLLAVGSLPTRQQRLLWLRAMGFSYAEMADHEGCTVRTVERQLLRAKGAVELTATPRLN
jgi:RNA polymerase sigma factor (sigma-70 family)